MVPAGFDPFTAGFNTLGTLAQPMPGGPVHQTADSGKSPTVISVGGLNAPPADAVDLLGAAQEFTREDRQGVIDTSRPPQIMGFLDSEMAKQVAVFVIAGLGVAITVNALGIRK